MRRYAETFFRYWLVALIPVLILPATAYAVIRHTPKGVIASSNIWIDQLPGNTSASYAQWETPAQIEVDTLNQLLQTSLFDTAVAQGSPRYHAMLLHSPDNGPAAAVDDISKNVKVMSLGSNLVNVSFSSTSKDWMLSQEVVQSVLDTARDQARVMSQQQSQQNIIYYTYQLRIAQQSEGQSAARLASYMAQKNISPLDLQTELPVDTNLANLYALNQQDVAAVNSAQQNLSRAQGQAHLPASLVGSSNFHVVDPPRVQLVSSKKQEIMDLAIALIVGLLLSGAFVVVKTATDRSVRFADEVETLFGLPVLAVVPFDAALAAPKHKSPRVSAEATGRGSMRRVS